MPRPCWRLLGSVASYPASTNVLLLQAGLLYPYVNNFIVYKCPADKKMVNGAPTIRSMSMNCWMDPLPISSWNYTRHYTGTPKQLTEFKTQSGIISPSPSLAWVFIDENPFSINDGMFVCDPNVPVWIDIPASYHNGACGLSFADGHSEIRAWMDPNILNCNAAPPASGTQASGPDLIWLQQRSTSLN